MGDKVSVIIPARNEQYLQRTIECVLEAAAEEVEVLAVCDGYWPNPPVKDHPNVNIIHYTDPVGQRQGINRAARIAEGKYIMKLDAHCSVGPGFDCILKRDCKYEWTFVPRMYNLDIETYQPKLIDTPETALIKGKAHDYMYISGPAHMKGDQVYGFRAMYYGKYSGANTPKPAINDKVIDETMCCMGPGWFMHKDRFWELGGLDEGHGSWGQMGIEVALKAWLSGGALMVHKGTWFAHWFRGGAGGFPYHITWKAQERARQYSRDLWLNNKWPKQTRTIEWLVEKFQPPTWELSQPVNGADVSESRLKMFAEMYKHIHRGKNDPSWKGIPVLKFPTDMTLYHEVIHETKPDFIVEIGTKYGGSALYFQDMLDACGSGGRVITVDLKSQVSQKDPRITYINGNSKDEKIIEQVRDMLSGRVMVVIDGNHERGHCKWDLHNYGPMVTKGQYLVVEDCYIDRGLYGPGEARDWFLDKHRGFVKTDRCSRYLVGVTMGGWLHRT